MGMYVCMYVTIIVTREEGINLKVGVMSVFEEAYLEGAGGKKGKGEIDIICFN